MTSIADRPDQKKETGERAWIAAIRDVLDRPLTSYHIVLGATGLLLVLGLMMVLSASSVLSLRVYGSSYTIFSRQLIWAAAGLPMAYVASRMTARHFRMLAYPALLGSTFLLVLTYIPGLGVGVNGNTNWLSLGGPLQIQPSEFAKLAMVMWCADLYARKEKLLTQWKHLLVPMVPVCGLVIAIVIGQHDLGTALVLMAVMIGMIWVVGAPARLFTTTIAVVGGVATYFVFAEKYRMQRVTSFLNPFGDPTGVGWQAYHSFYALSTGGWWGVGIGNSRQKWSNLPEAHTDFIFSVIGEELGLVGSLTVLALFLTLAYAGVRIATRNTQPFVRYAAAGITVWLMSQTLVNLGAVIGLLPIVGIPLPLLSYGGSALLPTLIAIGMLLSFAKAEPGAQAALKETRRPRFGWLPSRRTYK
ncbi:putative lipid II flippase FtsW [Kribbella sp.]|uniref:putative lipid II flippase FtsW n=1 Tax=Kribbella sp. TaxID=1871183 RepID=UPI002D559DAC|nr:putative lipid II flippase FtsW [Kribbella sp.]HZX04856.1 putative lipid II flippase FtsW [Kribbella sp.]